MLILGIETSCDETSVAILEHRGQNNLEIRANLIASQIEAHQLFGGVVPEIASRKHLEILNPLLETLWSEAKIAPRELDLSGVTSGPGLSGALLVGVAAGKALGYALQKPVRAVNHVEGHLVSTFLAHPDLELPMLALVVSGGHTDLILMRDFGAFERLGRTRDDAAGEAFDKVARALGLEIPGGPNLETLARQGNERAFHFGRSNLEPSFDFSYSGLKTAASQAFKKAPEQVADIAASFQRAAIAQLRHQVARALDEFSPATFGLCGGVAANGALRASLNQICAEKGVAFAVPPPILCTDNAAMIGAAAFFRARSEGFPAFDLAQLDFEARSVWPVG
ncbi:MAG: tRNA (adenosine(37)-N6)-threonylcarbamoyltransferase complex transferase subunit TsaD [Armatimonadetes bacterium]|nr:tRNA (adenosine(37)-N6)-threonylcarbamoyltransferase complex transferase subunit TsaD [Armatimonadota bacterium]